MGYSRAGSNPVHSEYFLHQRDCSATCYQLSGNFQLTTEHFRKRRLYTTTSKFLIIRKTEIAVILHKRLRCYYKINNFGKRETANFLLEAHTQRISFIRHFFPTSHSCGLSRAFQCYKSISYYVCRSTPSTAVMAEWLRRWTRNPMGYSRAGSNPAHSERKSFAAVMEHSRQATAVLRLFVQGCDGRVVKALDLKSNGLFPRRFESCSQRILFTSQRLFCYLLSTLRKTFN